MAHLAYCQTILTRVQRASGKLRNGELRHGNIYVAANKALDLIRTSPNHSVANLTESLFTQEYLTQEERLTTRIEPVLAEAVTYKYTYGGTALRDGVEAIVLTSIHAVRQELHFSKGFIAEIVDNSKAFPWVAFKPAGDFPQGISKTLGVHRIPSSKGRLIHVPAVIHYYLKKYPKTRLSNAYRTMVAGWILLQHFEDLNIDKSLHIHGEFIQYAQLTNRLVEEQMLLNYRETFGPTISSFNHEARPENIVKIIFPTVAGMLDYEDYDVLEHQSHYWNDSELTPHDDDNLLEGNTNYTSYLVDTDWGRHVTRGEVPFCMALTEYHRDQGYIKPRITEYRLPHLRVPGHGNGRNIEVSEKVLDLCIRPQMMLASGDKQVILPFSLPMPREEVAKHARRVNINPELIMGFRHDVYPMVTTQVHVWPGGKETSGLILARVPGSDQIESFGNKKEALQWIEDQKDALKMNEDHPLYSPTPAKVEITPMPADQQDEEKEDDTETVYTAEYDNHIDVDKILAVVSTSNKANEAPEEKVSIGCIQSLGIYNPEILE